MFTIILFIWYWPRYFSVNAWVIETTCVSSLQNIIGNCTLTPYISKCFHIKIILPFTLICHKFLEVRCMCVYIINHMYLYCIYDVMACNFLTKETPSLHHIVSGWRTSYAKWDKTDSKTRILIDFTYMWELTDLLSRAEVGAIRTGDVSGEADKAVAKANDKSLQT